MEKETQNENTKLLSEIDKIQRSVHELEEHLLLLTSTVQLLERQFSEFQSKSNILTEQQYSWICEQVKDMNSKQLWDFGTKLLKSGKINNEIFGKICAIKVNLDKQANDILQKVADDFDGVIVNEYN